MKAILELRRKQASRKVPTYTKDSILVGNLKELVNLSIQDIVQLLDQLGLDSPIFQSPVQSPPPTPRRIMDGNVPPNSNQPINPNPPLAWRARTPLNLAVPLHAFPQNDKKTLPKFDPGKGISMDDHLQSFYLALELLAMEHEYVVCRLFPNTFEDKASTCYFGSQANSIAQWDTFVRVFKINFVSQ